MILLPPQELPAGMTCLAVRGPLDLAHPVTVTLQGRAPGEDWVTLAEADLAPQTRPPHLVLQYVLGRSNGVPSVTVAGSAAQVLASAPLDGLTLEVT